MNMRLSMLAFLPVLPLAAALTQPVRTDAGAVSGVPARDGAVTAFKGIPYAAPPVGDLRWRAPQPTAAWQGVRAADKFSTSCVQTIVRERKPWTYEFMAHNEIGEDCLYLNVWTPAKSATDKLPVFFWIHGGGLVEGSTVVPVYDGEQMARKGAVVVTINYRLGVLGFLAHPELTRESGHNASGDYGLLDQLAALKWVQKNIAAFGGDPSRVTIAGQSAGSRSVHCLTVSPLAKGLFQRAIAESGSGVRRVTATPLAKAEQDGVKFATAHGAQSLAQLRAQSWQELVAVPASGQAIRFGLVVEGHYLPEQIDDAIADGHLNDVPFLTGMVTEEGSSAANWGTIPAADWEKQMRARYGDLADAFFRLYPADAQHAGASQKSAARDFLYVSLDQWAANRQKAAKSEVFTYYWSHPEPGPDRDRYGAFHTSEVPYVFNSLAMSDRPWTADDRKIADTMSAYWVNFAATGNPNGKGLPEWRPFRAGAGTVMELGEHFAPRPVAGDAALKLFREFLARPGTPGE
jgi:para-nitrobenzyl esterase